MRCRPAKRDWHELLAVNFCCSYNLSCLSVYDLQRAVHGPISVSGETFDELSVPLVHADFPWKRGTKGLVHPWHSYGPMAPKSPWKFWSTPVLVHWVLFSADSEFWWGEAGLAIELALSRMIAAIRITSIVILFSQHPERTRNGPETDPKRTEMDPKWTEIKLSGVGWPGLSGWGGL